MHLPFASGRLNNALRVYWLTLFGNRQVVEIEKVLHSSRFQLTDVATAGSGARNQGADVTLVKISNAFNAEPPIEQHRCRSSHKKQGGAPENQERQKSCRHSQSVPREICLRGDLAEQCDHDHREEERTKSCEHRVG
jgi:hypothetical protein